MDEVRVERLIKKYKDNGELASEDPALVMLKKWPASKQYQDNSDRLPGLEQLVFKLTISFIFTYYCYRKHCVGFNQFIFSYIQ